MFTNFKVFSFFLSKQDRLVSILFGLLRKHKFHFLHSYRDEAYSTIKSTIRQVCLQLINQVTLDPIHQLLIINVLCITKNKLEVGNSEPFNILSFLHWFFFRLCKILWQTVLRMKKKGNRLQHVSLRHC